MTTFTVSRGLIVLKVKVECVPQDTSAGYGCLNNPQAHPPVSSFYSVATTLVKALVTTHLEWWNSLSSDLPVPRFTSAPNHRASQWHPMCLQHHGDPLFKGILKLGLKPLSLVLKVLHDLSHFKVSQTSHCTYKQSNYIASFIQFSWPSTTLQA